MNRQYKQQRLVVAISMVAAFFLIATVLPLSWVRAGTALISYPVLKTNQFFTTMIHDWRVQSRDRAVLAHALADAEQVMDSLNMQIHQLQQAGQLYDEIKELVEFKKRFAGAKALIAAVARREINAARHHILLDVGSTSGVSLGMVAIYNHMLVGRVIEVQALYCRVALITDASVSVAVFCTNTKTTGIVKGNNDASALQLLYVDHLSPLEVGDQVVSSGEGLVFPRGFLLGSIVSDETIGIYHNALVKPALDVTKLTHVLLLHMADLKPQCEEIKPATEQPTVANEPKKPRERRRRLESAQTDGKQPAIQDLSQQTAPETAQMVPAEGIST